MTPFAIVFMIIVLAFYWGGFTFLTIKATKSDN